MIALSPLQMHMQDNFLLDHCRPILSGTGHGARHGSIPNRAIYLHHKLDRPRSVPDHRHVHPIHAMLLGDHLHILIDIHLAH